MRKLEPIRRLIDVLESKIEDVDMPANVNKEKVEQNLHNIIGGLRELVEIAEIKDKQEEKTCN
ncbi:hypothetical protein [Romboutsia lituseburensis]|uniref:hypothetical protein n=1 Tax=Romboutsia lituseburensis TaxID=1537 RepID=UPI0022EAC816|nr:hypothetical protein [Romboutsia lituseburensis]